MNRREAWVKRLGPQRGVEFRETAWGHERERAQTTHVTVGERASIIELEAHRDVPPGLGWERSIVDEQRPGEARLDHQLVARVERHDDCLRSAIAALDAGSRRASRQ